MRFLIKKCSYSCLIRKHKRCQVQRKGLIPTIEGDLMQWTVAKFSSTSSRYMIETIKSAEFFFAGCDGIGRCLWNGSIGSECQSIVAQAGCRFLSTFWIAPDYNYARSMLYERRSCRQADTGSTPDDDNCFFFKPGACHA